MQAVSTLVRPGMQQAQQQEQAGASSAVKNLFLMLQGSYGTAFLAKFSTGVKDEQGRDLGIRASMKVWQARLAKYPDDVVAMAFNRITLECPEFPPSLPQMEKACEAAMPRKTHAELAGWVALPAPVKPAPIKVEIKRKGDGKDGYRIIWARHLEGDKTVSLYALRNAIEVLKKLGELK